MTTWTLDPAHLHVGFAVRHMMVATVKGRFTEVTAEIAIDEEQPERSSVDVRIGAASVETGMEKRDEHLRSADFFDAEQFPELRFTSTRVERAQGSRFVLEGDLTIRGVTQPVRLEGELEGPVTGPWGGRHAGFTLQGEVDREAYGLTWNVGLEAGGVMVGRTVKLAIDGELLAASEDETAVA